MRSHRGPGSLLRGQAMPRVRRGLTVAGAVMALTGSSFLLPAAGASGSVPAQDPPSGPALASSAQPWAPPPQRAAPAASTWFAAAFPAQERAVQDATDPASRYWAVLIGINDYEAPTRHNLGARQDAEDLALHLRDLGWRDDHLLLLTDRSATRGAVEEAIAWLARKTDAGSVAVLHYSGHTRQYTDSDEVALWPADNRPMPAEELVDRLAPVNAGRLWLDIGACEAEAYVAPGFRRPGRVATLASHAWEKAYEEPAAAHTVWGYYLVDEALRSGKGDTDRDGDVTVQEGFAYAAPRAARRTSQQTDYGPQHPVMIDDGEMLSLRPR